MKLSRKGFILLGILLTLVLTVAAVVFQTVRPPKTEETPIVSDGLTVAAQGKENGLSVPKRKQDFFTILFIGRDKVGLNTDVLMLMAYDIANGKVSLMSIPRDTMTDVKRKNKKINSAYAHDGKGDLEELMSEIQSIVGFRPDFHLLVSIDGFVKLIDAIGGVTMDVPIDMYYSDPGQDLTIDLKKGERTLSGYDAMGLMRFRASYARGDLDRIEMQHKFIDAFLDKLVTPKTLPKIPELAEILVQNVKTDLTAGNFVWMAKKALELDLSEDFHLFTLPGEAGYYEQRSYFIAYEDETLDLINAHFNPYVDPISDLDHPHVKLSNGTYSDQLDKEETKQ